ncbi:MAG: acyl-CoA desaturase [Pseudonocardia sp.]|uniref:acyl-CoA desaturase n=1 Tax=Pseudonocardia sp. TaxID=60912 RepID=UPI001AD0ABB0|nr:acyl-CoA desaturase [Pseudonocardia sp.]MBN9097208.1 acyl-CoA desaturase [Pseudonocardia sp.]
MTPSLTAEAPTRGTPIIEGRRGLSESVLVHVFVIVPVVALVLAVPLAWGWGLSWLDVGLAAAMYVISILGITVGFHRYFTHRSFVATPALRSALAIAGSLALQGDPITWVADHRRHHAFSDKEGDPHSPWLHGTGPVGLAKGFWHAHMGWLFEADKTNADRFVPDLVSDPAVARISRQFGIWVAVSLLLPALVGGLVTMSWAGALSAFVWAGLVRVGLAYHVTWSINSICHMIGNRPFAARDRSANVWPLAILSMGESWHNLHHADPTCARHGVQRGQIDISARTIWIFEKLGWARDVRWPTTKRLARLTAERSS